ncbi:LuxR C-terminal-related transcriptional regulator [Lentzea sp. NPDC004782]|uniref:helix-turn-helix transcriptional regulator n=1 Tax=Lentzea sp. NPDC004782 TaxID=3154458 RepID=UPI0033BE7591
MTSQTVWTTIRPAATNQTRRELVRVMVQASDPLVTSGITTTLHSIPGIALVAEPSLAEVVVAVADSSLPALHTHGSLRIVLIADDVRHPGLLAAVEHGLIVLVPRMEATHQAHLLRAISAVHRSHGHVAAEHQNSLRQVLLEWSENDPRSTGPSSEDLSPREVEVLRFLAAGLDTSEIAERLIYSERTVKNVLHNLLNRRNLRNRAHAVAYALRQGLI